MTPLEINREADYIESLEFSLVREREAFAETRKRLERQARTAHRAGVREGVLLAALVLACVGVVAAVFVAAYLNGGGGS